jgi:hypothetical protein
MLPVPSLWPRVGEVEEKARKDVIGDVVLSHPMTLTANYKQISQSIIFSLGPNASDPIKSAFDGHPIMLRVGSGLLDDPMTVAGAIFREERRVIFKKLTPGGKPKMGVRGKPFGDKKNALAQENMSIGRAKRGF